VVLKTPQVDAASRTGAAGKKGDLKRGVKRKKIDVENYPSIMKEALRKWAFLGREGVERRVCFLARGIRQHFFFPWL
jgi:hypothetical protein